MMMMLLMMMMFSHWITSLSSYPACVHITGWNKNASLCEGTNKYKIVRAGSITPVREGNSTNELWCTIPNNLQPNNIKNISMVLYVDSKKKNERKKRKGKHKDGTAVEGDTGDLKREKQNKKHKERIAVEGETRLCA